MSHDNPPTNTPGTSPETDRGPGYEVRDANLRVVVWLAFGVFMGTMVVMGGLLLLQQKYIDMANQRDPELTPLRAERTRPHGPRLQASPTADYVAFRAEQEERLNTYGIIDRADPEHPVVHIPIERAMQLIAEQGLPKVEAQPPQQDSPRDDTPQLDPQPPRTPDEIGPQQR
jgi:hypothetical protein